MLNIKMFFSCLLIDFLEGFKPHFSKLTIHNKRVMEKTVFLCLVKVLSVVNNWDFVSMLIDAYANDIPYYDNIMRNAYWMMVIYLKCRIMKKPKLTIQRTFPRHRKSSPNRTFPKKNFLCVFSSFYHALKKRT